MPSQRDGGQVDGAEVAKSQSPTRSTAETEHGGRAPAHLGGCRPICHLQHEPSSQREMVLRTRGEVGSSLDHRCGSLQGNVNWDISYHAVSSTS